MVTQTNHITLNVELNEYWQKLISLKPEFDKIRAKSYKDALKFWDENIIPHAANHPLKPLRDPLPLTFYLSLQESSKHRASSIELEERPEDILTLAPTNDAEKALFNEWYIKKHLNEYAYNVEIRKQIFQETLIRFKSIKAQKECIEREIAKVIPKKINPNPDRSVHPNALRLAIETQKKLDSITGIDAYRERRELPDLNKMDFETALNFMRLKCNEDFKEYLEQQLEMIEQRSLNGGGMPSMIDLSNNKGNNLHGWSAINGGQILAPHNEGNDIGPLNANGGRVLQAEQADIFEHIEEMCSELLPVCWKEYNTAKKNNFNGLHDTRLYDKTKYYQHYVREKLEKLKKDIYSYALGKKPDDITNYVSFAYNRLQALFEKNHRFYNEALKIYKVDFDKCVNINNPDYQYRSEIQVGLMMLQHGMENDFKRYLTEDILFNDTDEKKFERNILYCYHEKQQEIKKHHNHDCNVRKEAVKYLEGYFDEYRKQYIERYDYILIKWQKLSKEKVKNETEIDYIMERLKRISNLFVYNGVNKTYTVTDYLGEPYIFDEDIYNKYVKRIFDFIKTDLEIRLKIMPTEVKIVKGIIEHPIKNSELDRGANSAINLPKEKWNFILKLLDDLSITANDQYLLGDKGMGAIRGVVEAAREANILPRTNLHAQIQIIACKINMPLSPKTKLEKSTVCGDYKVQATKYIKDHYKAE